MLRRLCLALAILCLGVVPAAAGRDWSRVATRTADGAFVEGNPRAKVKLVEYFSFTCPHCARFEAEAIGPLTAKYIRTGLVSYEVRHAVRDGFDLTASLLSRCSGPVAFFSVAPAVFAQQEAWMTQASKWVETNPGLDGQPPEKTLPKVAAGSGLDALFRAHGLPQARLDACLVAPADRSVLTGMANAAWTMPGFPGTPAFSINGRMIAAHSWAELEQQIGQALH